jgi:hypothetical protein
MKIPTKKKGGLAFSGPVISCMISFPELERKVTTDQE